jgi:hypothetical protein
MDDTDRERMEQLTEALGECLATVATLREELAAVRADLAAVVEAQHRSVAAMQVQWSSARAAHRRDRAHGAGRSV